MAYLAGFIRQSTLVRLQPPQPSKFNYLINETELLEERKILWDLVPKIKGLQVQQKDDTVGQVANIWLKESIVFLIMTPRRRKMLRSSFHLRLGSWNKRLVLVVVVMATTIGLMKPLLLVVKHQVL